MNQASEEKKMFVRFIRSKDPGLIQRSTNFAQTCSFKEEILRVLLDEFGTTDMPENTFGILDSILQSEGTTKEYAMLFRGMAVRDDDFKKILDKAAVPNARKAIVRWIEKGFVPASFGDGLACFEEKQTSGREEIGSIRLRMKQDKEKEWRCSGSEKEEFDALFARTVLATKEDEEMLCRETELWRAESGRRASAPKRARDERGTTALIVDFEALFPDHRKDLKDRRLGKSVDLIEAGIQLISNRVFFGRDLFQSTETHLNALLKADDRRSLANHHFASDTLSRQRRNARNFSGRGDPTCISYRLRRIGELFLGFASEPWKVDERTAEAIEAFNQSKGNAYSKARAFLQEMKGSATKLVIASRRTLSETCGFLILLGMGGLIPPNNIYTYGHTSVEIVIRACRRFYLPERTVFVSRRQMQLHIPEIEFHNISTESIDVVLSFL
eukprot:GHVN01033853.1.p1 GENE.GHVN01033853.1~~GHVN01033853.1.p1  ORF type:complete len:443 (-),score=38.51 GHVN01033853.1:545-1873(-)